ncbi:MAG TPA: ATP-binding cassette domain-containing protein [Gemmatimonadales bacterium]
MIHFQAVTKSFGPTVVLDRLDLEIPTGRTTVIIGRSGCGKSVLLKHVVGLQRPDAGRVTVDGAVVHELDPEDLERLRFRVGYVFQFAALLDSLSVGDNIRLGLRRRGLPPGEIERRMRESLAVVGLEGNEHRYPAALSGGMRKRVGVARAVALRPDYILFDEPTTGLDPITTASLDELMLRARRELGATCVVISHDMKSVFTVADRIALLHHGRIRQVGAVDEIRTSDDPVVRAFLEGRPERVETA